MMIDTRVPAVTPIACKALASGIAAFWKSRYVSRAFSCPRSDSIRHTSGANVSTASCRASPIELTWVKSIIAKSSSQARLHPFGQGSEIAHALHFVIRQFDVKVVFQPGKHFQRLQAVDVQLSIEIVFGLQRSAGRLELLLRQPQDFLRRFFQCTHSHNLSFPPTGWEIVRAHSAACYSRISPRRIPIATASARDAAPSFPKIEAT